MRGSKKEHVLSLLGTSGYQNFQTIAEQVGCSREFVRQVANACTKVRSSKWETTDRSAELVNTLRETKSIVLAAKETGFTPCQIGRLKKLQAKDLKLVRPDSSRWRKGITKYPPELLIALYEKHKNYTYMAEELGIKPPNISMLMKKYNLREQYPSRRGGRRTHDI